MLLVGGAVNSPTVSGGAIAAGVDRNPLIDDWNYGSALEDN